MKVASLVALLVLAACKPDPTSTPAAAETPPASPAQPRPRAPAPALPSQPQAQAGSDTGSADDADPGSAAPGRRARLDRNGDGLVSPEERLQAQADRAKRMHDRFDANHDGKLTPDELAGNGSARRGPHFDDPAALDTDKNGEISPEELQQGLRDLRAKSRGHEAAGGSAD